MAELLQSELGLTAELVEGDLGEFKVLVDDCLVAEKGWFFLPNPRKVVDKIRRLQGGSSHPV